MYVRLNVGKRSTVPIAFLVVLLQATAIVVQIHFRFDPPPVFLSRAMRAEDICDKTFSSEDF
jgi:hypothetical protein